MLAGGWGGTLAAGAGEGAGGLLAAVAAAVAVVDRSPEVGRGSLRAVVVAGRSRGAGGV